MSYAAQENSQYGGAPVELVLFRESTGAGVDAYTTGEDEVLDGLVLYKPGIISRTSIKQNSSNPTGNIEITLPNDAPVVQAYRAYLPSKPISVVIVQYHVTDADVERRTMFVGEIKTIEFGGEGMATMACEPVTRARGKKVPWPVTKKNCVWALYGFGCGVLRASFATPVLAYSISGTTLTATAVGSQSDGWFRGGYIEVVETGDRRFITGHTGNALTLEYPFFNLPAGAALIAYAGCDRTRQTCKTKFNNLPAYLGFDYIPTENPYDTNFGPTGTTNAPTSVFVPYFGDVNLEG